MGAGPLIADAVPTEERLDVTVRRVDGDGGRLLEPDRIVVEGFPLTTYQPHQPGRALPAGLLQMPHISVFVADFLGTPSGACMTVKDTNGVGGVYWVAVLPEHRRAGMGRALMLAAMRELAGLPMVLCATRQGRRSTGRWDSRPHWSRHIGRSATRPGDLLLTVGVSRVEGSVRIRVLPAHKSAARDDSDEDPDGHGDRYRDHGRGWRAPDAIGDTGSDQPSDHERQKSDPNPRRTRCDASGAGVSRRRGHGANIWKKVGKVARAPRIPSVRPT